MKTLLILLFVLLLALSVCGCGSSTTESDMDSIPFGSTTSSDGISIITEEKAIEIASQHWGVKNGDKDEITGFPFLIIPVESSNDNIKISLKWLVDNLHYSTVDLIEIDPCTGKIVNFDTEE